jgi:hypothetical protein
MNTDTKDHRREEGKDPSQPKPEVFRHNFGREMIRRYPALLRHHLLKHWRFRGCHTQYLEKQLVSSKMHEQEGILAQKCRNIGENHGGVRSEGQCRPLGQGR